MLIFLTDSALLCFTCLNIPNSKCNAQRAELGPRPMMTTTVSIKLSLDFKSFNLSSASD